MWVSRPGLVLETDQDHFFEVLVLGLDPAGLGLGLGLPGLGLPGLGLGLDPAGLGLGLGLPGLGLGLGLGGWS